jgi:hypothetical protein
MTVDEMPLFSQYFGANARKFLWFQEKMRGFPAFLRGGSG